MNVGFHIMAWRRRRALTQADLAERARLSRPYLSKLEKGSVDPALSSLRRLAVALQIGVGDLIEKLPPAQSLSRADLDQLARGALRPGTFQARGQKATRVLALLNHERRKALGFYSPRPRTSKTAKAPSSGLNASRWLRAALGEKQWSAILRRIDKLAGAETLLKSRRDR